MLFYLPVFMAMLALGFWQLQRAELKASVIAAAERARQAPPVSIESIEDPIEAAGSYRRVSVTGRWLPARQLLWDNRVYRGVAGYEVITPLALDDGRLILVNRGWIAPGPTRAELPSPVWPDASSVESPAAVSPTGDEPGEVETRVTGLLSRPSKGFMSGPALEPGRGWPGVLQYFDFPVLSRRYGTTVVPAVLQWQPSTVDRSAAPPLAANWQPVASGPERHYGYAFQWFAMALALTVVLIVVNSRRIGHAPADASGPRHDASTGDDAYRDTIKWKDH